VKTASIATAKNQLSRLLKRVQGGESILITDRNHPVAILQAVAGTDNTLAGLHAAGILSPPRNAVWDALAFAGKPRAKLTAATSLAAAVLAERQEGR